MKSEAFSESSIRYSFVIKVRFVLKLPVGFFFFTPINMQSLVLDLNLQVLLSEPRNSEFNDP